MLIGALIGFGLLVASWLVLPGKREAATETQDAMPSLVGELLQPSRAQ